MGLISFSDPSLTRTLGALIKFCSDHNYNEIMLAELEQVLHALEKRDFTLAASLFRALPAAPSAAWFEWYPSVAYEHENSEYVSAVFEALSNHWIRLMRSALGEDDRPKKASYWPFWTRQLILSRTQTAGEFLPSLFQRAEHVLL